LEVMKAWGFAYVSGAVWVKDRIGTGYWFRNRHELLLVGTRGNVPAPAMGTQWDSVIAAAAGDHSAKPDAVLKMIEAYFPSVPKIELNCRGVPRPGWDAWGNEAAKESEFRYVLHADIPSFTAEG
jgi:N6-adenosine-specific RNA methylase IME4